MLYTLKKENGHEHLGVFSAKLQSGTSTEEDNHVHKLLTMGVTRDNEPILPGSVNVEIAGEKIFCLSAGVPAHIHELEEFDQSYSPKKEEDSEIMAEQVDTYKAYKRLSEESDKKSEKALRYRYGRQWDEKKLQELGKDKSNPPIVVDLTGAMINVVSGYFRQDKKDIEFAPVEEGDALLTTIANKVTKVVLRQNMFEHKSIRVVDSALTAGKGFLVFYEKRTLSQKGEVKMKVVDWHNIKLGPHREPDLSDCDDLFITEWMGWDEVKTKYPEEAEEMSPFMTDNVTDVGSSTVRMVAGGNQFEDNAIELNNGENTSLTETMDKIDKQVLLLERWKKVKIIVPVVVIPGGEAIPAMGLNKSQKSKLKKIKGVRIIDNPTHIMRRVLTVGSVILEDEYPDVPDNDFPVCPMYGQFFILDGVMWWQGKVHAVTSLQDEINIRHAQMIANAASLNNGGYFVGKDAFANGAQKAAAKAAMRKPGFIVEVERIDQIKEVTPTAINSSIAQMEAMSVDLFRTVSGVSAEANGQINGQVSGKALIQQKSSLLTALYNYFDAHSLFLTLVGIKLLHYIQAIMTPAQILRIIRNEHSKTPFTVPNPETGEEVDFSELEDVAIIQLLKTKDLAHLDAEVVESAFSKTFRAANFMDWMDLAKQGVEVPTEMLVELSDLADKEKYKKIIAEKQKQAMEAAQQQQQAEIAKSGTGKAMIENQQG